MLRVSAFSRKPPAWRDPAYPDVPLNALDGGWAKLGHMQRLQAQRGLPPLDFRRAGALYAGRPRLRLSAWDKRQKRVRSVDICGDIVMTPAQWNNLHPLFRPLVPQRLLPPGALGNRVLGPIPGPA